MRTFSSGRMDNGVTSSSEDSSDPKPDFDTILQYLIRSAKVRIPSLDRDDNEDEFVITNTAGQPNTEVLDESEVSIFTKQSSGLIYRLGDVKSNSIVAMVCARERGMHGRTTFSKADCCKINNNFLPNKSKVVASYPTKIFCGFYFNNGNTFLSASQDEFIRLFDTTNGNFKLIKTILARDVGWSILDVAISPDGNYLAYSSWCECLQLCKIWDNTENQNALLLSLDDRKFCIFSLKFSANGKEILCGANNGYIYVYDRECSQTAFRMLPEYLFDARLMKHQENKIESTVWNCMGGSVCCESDGEDTLLKGFLKLNDGKITAASVCLALLKGHNDDVNAVAFADEGSQILYSGGDDGICRVWDRRTLMETNPKPVGCLAGHLFGITFIEPRGDGRHLLTNSKDQSIKLWDVRKFSSNLGVINTMKAVESMDWDYRSKRVPKSLRNPNKRLQGDTSVMTYCGHSVLQTLCRCHFSPAETTGQRYIYTGCAKGRVIVYDVLTGKIIEQLRGHRTCVRDVAWHPYLPELTSVSWDGKIIRWTYYKKSCLDSGEEDRWWEALMARRRTRANLAEGGARE